MCDVSTWMAANRLKMNPTKTEFIYFGSRQMLEKCEIEFLNVTGDIINRTDLIRCLGVWLDSQLSFNHHVNQKCKVAYINIRNIRSIRKFITVEIGQVLVSSLVLSHLDYCNAILYGLPENTLHKMQRVENCAAKLVLQRKRFDSSTDALRELHWLPVKQRICYKIALIVFKCLHDLAPEYLKCLIKLKTYAMCLRSASVNAVVLEVPVCSRRTFYDRSFAVSGPTVWNALPFELRQIDNLDTFKDKLKTYYSKQAFNV